MTLTGTIANINAALNGLSYTANPGYIGGDELQVHTDDLGNCGVGGALTADSTVNISVLGGPVVNATIDGIQQTTWQSPQAVAADANGNYVVVWTSQTATGWDIYARRFNASGNAQGDEFLVNSVTASGDHTAGDQMYAAVAMNADGSLRRHLDRPERRGRLRRRLRQGLQCRRHRQHRSDSGQHDHRRRPDVHLGGDGRRRRLRRRVVEPGTGRRRLGRLRSAV